MSIALYRRYRPESFQEVIGQDHVTKPLKAALEAGRTTHAYLFSGPRGCGKTTSARILARCLNCVEYPTATPCGVCDSCKELSRDGSGSLDVVELDAASHGGVDDARELREQAGFAPVRDRFKIFIIDEAHMVTNQGFNALLKLVEEPPPHVKFIFATTEPEKVIGTIRSRTHHYPFRLVPPLDLEKYLALLCAQEGVSAGKDLLSLVVRAGTGSVRDTLSVLDQIIGGSEGTRLDYERAVALLGYTSATLLDEAINAITARDGAGIFGVVDAVVKSGHDPRRFVEDLLQRLRDLVIISLAGEEAKDVFVSVPEDQYATMIEQASALGAERASQCADLTNEALSEMAGATAPRLQLELLCARLIIARVGAPEQQAVVKNGPEAPTPEVASSLAKFRSRAGSVAAPQAQQGPQAQQAPQAQQGPQAQQAPQAQEAPRALQTPQASAVQQGQQAPQGQPASQSRTPQQGGVAPQATPAPQAVAAPQMAPSAHSIPEPQEAPAPHEPPRQQKAPIEQARPTRQGMPTPQESLVDRQRRLDQMDPRVRPMPAMPVDEPSGEEGGSRPRAERVNAPENPQRQEQPTPALDSTSEGSLAQVASHWGAIISDQSLSRIAHAQLNAARGPVSVEEGVLYVGFDQPGVANAFTARGAREVEQILSTHLNLSLRVQGRAGGESPKVSAAQVAAPTQPHADATIHGASEAKAGAATLGESAPQRAPMPVPATQPQPAAPGRETTAAPATETEPTLPTRPSQQARQVYSLEPANSEPVFEPGPEPIDEYDEALYGEPHGYPNASARASHASPATSQVSPTFQPSPTSEPSSSQAVAPGSGPDWPATPTSSAASILGSAAENFPMPPPADLPANMAASYGETADNAGDGVVKMPFSVPPVEDPFTHTTRGKWSPPPGPVTHLTAVGDPDDEPEPAEENPEWEGASADDPDISQSTVVGLQVVLERFDAKVIEEREEG
ncbi:DNA polymerase III subunit gamma and tau [Trueperella pecoris]|uniref:DNA-directed DNA polymerase n=1 Tax=Trueperella pecoris TaxID=2733571 RepID=A0A7M1QZH0_9ACTO|nr:DNA polymerase III subunit gamma and tau [Trueperella pecoris]QOR47482.1 DNA polymerase III subunit gamma and tau [Trueperella pecoris]